MPSRSKPAIKATTWETLSKDEKDFLVILYNHITRDKLAMPCIRSLARELNHGQPWGTDRIKTFISLGYLTKRDKTTDEKAAYLNTATSELVLDIVHLPDHVQEYIRNSPFRTGEFAVNIDMNSNLCSPSSTDIINDDNQAEMIRPDNRDIRTPGFFRKAITKKDRATKTSVTRFYDVSVRTYRLNFLPDVVAKTPPVPTHPDIDLLIEMESKKIF